MNPSKHLTGADIDLLTKPSMVYWWPRVKGLEVPMPKTVLIGVDPGKVYDMMGDAEVAGKWKEECRLIPELGEIQAAADELGYPVFLRTDMMAGKHDWVDTCFVRTASDLMGNIFRVAEATLACDMLGRPVLAFVVREFLEMMHYFTAFRGALPISAERRYFVQDGKVVCHHPYWPKAAIRRPSVEDWEERLKKVSRETSPEVEMLTIYAQLISQKLPGYWSVDFCMSRDGTWYFIDCAPGAQSWHPDCDKKVEE